MAGGLDSVPMAETGGGDRAEGPHASLQCISDSAVMGRPCTQVKGHLMGPLLTSRLFRA
jgi:hypothetical protein